MRLVLANYKRMLFRVIGVLAIILLASCTRSDNYVPEKQLPKLPCKVRGACDSTIAKSIIKLNKNGIKVVTIGEDYLISIPASALFYDQSPHIKWGSYGALNEVARFLKQFRKVAINVTSYSSKYVSVQREHALTLARSRVVGEYLWTQGIDSRFIFTQGLGSDKPIVRFNQGGDRSPNARIEITFRNAVA